MTQGQRKKIVATERKNGVKGARHMGWIPAVVYGHGLKNQHIQIENKQFGVVLAEAGQSSLIDLEVAGAKKGDVNTVLIRDVQYHPVRGHILHVDFYQPRLDELITADVPIRFIGESPAVKDMGGVLVKALDELEIEALPVDLPRDIEVDISSLTNFELSIKVADLQLPPRVKIKHEPDDVVVLVQPPRSEEEISQLSEEVKEDVTAVEGVKDEVKEEETGEASKASEASKDSKENSVQPKKDKK